MRAGAAAMLPLVLPGLLLTAGCGEPGGSGDQRPTTSAASGGPLARARDLAGRDGSLVFTHRVVTEVGGGSLVRTYRGRVDLARRRWQLRFTLQDRTSGRLAPGDGVLTVVGVGQTAYLSSTGWPERARGRWLKLAPADAAEALQLRIDPDDGLPAGIDAVADVVAAPGPTPSGSTSAAAGGGRRQVGGRVPVATALGLLGLESDLRKQGVAIEGLSGAAGVRISLGPDGRLRRLALDGADLSASPQLPGTAAEMVRTTTAVVAFGEWGVPVSIREPAANRLVRPDEM